MSDTCQGPGWWLASDGKWYPPELWTGPPGSGPAGPRAPQPLAPSHPGQAEAYGEPGGFPSGQPAYVAAPVYGAGQYGAGQYGAGQYAPSAAPARTNGLAIASLVCSCAGLFLLPAILGVIFGFVARSQIKVSAGAQRGDGLALAGIIVGFGWLALLVVTIVFGNTARTNGMVGPGALGLLGLTGPFN